MIHFPAYRGRWLAVAPLDGAGAILTTQQKAPGVTAPRAKTKQIDRLTMKIDVEKVKTLVADAGRSVQVPPDELAKLIRRLQDMLPEPEAEEEKPPAQKKQYVILVSDPLHQIEAGAELAGWVLQIPEDASPLSLHERIQKAAYDFNASRRGRKLPVQTVGETLESVPAKSLKEVELWCKTRMPVLVLTTNNELPNTPCLFGDDNRGAKVDDIAVEIRTGANVVRIDADGINSKPQGPKEAA